MNTNSLDSDDIELVWKLPTTSWIMNSYKSVYLHGEDSFSKMLEKELEEAGDEGLPPEHPDQDRLYIHRKSFLLILYALLERHLYSLCNLAAKHFNLTSVKSATRNFKNISKIEKYKKYLEENLGIQWKTLKDEWGFIDELREVRNSYVHDNSSEDINERTKIIRKHCQRTDEILPSEYLEQSLNNIDTFFQKLEGKMVEIDNQKK